MNSNFFFVGKYRRLFFAVPVCTVAYSLILFSFAYSSANWAQKQYEDIVIGALLSDTDRLTINKNVTRFAITGNLGRSPLLINSARKYPLISALVPVHIWGEWYWGYMQLKFMGLPLAQANINEAEKLDIIKNNEPVVNKTKYSIYLVDNLLLIRFL